MKFIALFLCLTSLEALAHPTDDGSLLELGVGTQLQVIRDINIPASKSGHTFGRRISQPGESEYLQYCTLNSEASPRDRVIKAGTVYTIQDIKKEYKHSDTLRSFGETYSILVNSSKIDISCVCSFARFKNRIKIGDFKSITSDSLKVILAEPEIIR